MTLYDIDQQILSLIDSETGEILDFEAFEALNLERETKIENIALWHKELVANAEAIKAEEKKLSERRKAMENNAERLKKTLSLMLDGQKFSTSRVAVSFRNSKAVVTDDEFIQWCVANGNEDLLTTPKPTVNKIAVKESIKNGFKLEFARIIETKSISIK